MDLKKDQIFRLGLVLGLRVPTLDNMKDSPAFLYDMLAGWLQGQDNVDRRGGHTWGTLVKGLRHPSVAQNETADRIHSERCLGYFSSELPQLLSKSIEILVAEMQSVQIYMSVAHSSHLFLPKNLLNYSLLVMAY